MLILNTLFIKSIEMLNVNYLSAKLEKHLHYYYIYFNNEYFFIAVFILTSFLVTNLMFFSAFFLSLKAKSFEKSSPYECGFEPFDSNAHGVFNVQYFVVGILFMIFDLEMSYLYC